MKIVIIGGSGVIGTRLAAILRRRGHEVAAILADVATGAPANATIEIAGPEAAGMDEPVRRHLAAKGDSRNVVADPAATYFGQPIDLRSLVPADGARLGPARLDAWLAAAHAD